MAVEDGRTAVVEVSLPYLHVFFAFVMPERAVRASACCAERAGTLPQVTA